MGNLCPLVSRAPGLGLRIPRGCTLADFRRPTRRCAQKRQIRRRWRVSTRGPPLLGYSMPTMGHYQKPCCGTLPIASVGSVDGVCTFLHSVFFGGVPCGEVPCSPALSTSLQHAQASSGGVPHTTGCPWLQGFQRTNNQLVTRQDERFGPRQVTCTLSSPM
jgi:hypothetical protein